LNGWPNASDPALGRHRTLEARRSQYLCAVHAMAIETLFPLHLEPPKRDTVRKNMNDIAVHERRITQHEPPC
jgi:hypothetical protein